MEKERAVVNSDKVKKLQETIKRLELQNEQLRAQQQAKNGLVVPQVCDNNVTTDSNRAVDDFDIIPLNDIDLSDGQTWLYIPEKVSECDSRCDIEVWLRRRVEAAANSFRNPKTTSAIRSLDFDAGDKQSIDTRTFTRPKKRFGMLSTASSSGLPEGVRRREEKDMTRNDDLSAMLQSAGLPLKGVLDSILQKHRKTNIVGEETVIIAEEKGLSENSTNNKLDSTFIVEESPDLPVKGLLSGILQKHRNTNVVGVEAVIHSEEGVKTDSDHCSELGSTFMVQEKIWRSIAKRKKEQYSKIPKDLVRVNSASRNFHPLLKKEDEPDIVLSARRVLGVRESSLPRRSLGSTGVKGSCPALDQTFQIVNGSPQSLVRGKRETGSTSILDCTYSMAKNNSPHSEEDCLSTTSDGSLSSSSRPMNADDVQQIARLQEESLKQSTPVCGKKSILEVDGEDMPSPIHQGCGSDDNHGYHSDRSSPIGSLTDGGGRGPSVCSRGSSLTGGDSLQSSPMTSPHSSTQTLHQLPAHNGLPVRESRQPLKSYPCAPSRDNVIHNHGKEVSSALSQEVTVVDAVPAVPNMNSGASKLPPGVGPPLAKVQVDQVGPPVRSGPGRGGIRPPSAPSGIPRPQSRFQSRIPAPTQRIPASRAAPKKPPKVDWMDGCY
ncbi:uncharacterized protein LOC124162911 isoform X2 [Ischnura elegans]|uniref:uncharacterized protein LOC124162911 isoform X2 n=1 Tax=Ischnura elegans TaxID=197161 RepID=UPI001ED87212|nr:uncharacterized protein LOC124162911 isoform X2 [Ischnura elegans]